MKERKIVSVRRKVSFAEAEEEDFIYWDEKSIKERVSEATAWIKKVWAFQTKIHGEYSSLSDGKHIKKLIDEDDF
jgi:hypothetical protein